MNNHDKTLLVALAAASLFSLPAAAKDYVSKVEMSFGIDTGNIVNVGGKDGLYLEAKAQTLNFKPSVKATCADGAHVTSYGVVAADDPQSGSVIESHDASYPHVNGAHNSSRQMDWTPLTLKAPVDQLFPKFNPLIKTIKDQFAATCNGELLARQSKTQTKAALLSKGFDTQVAHPFTFLAFCEKNSNSSKFSAESVVQQHNIRVHCLPIP